MSVPRAYLDTNVFIAAYEAVGAHSDHAQWILLAIERQEIVGVASELALSELLVKPIERQDTELVNAYKAIFFSTGGFDVVPVLRDVLVSAAELRASRSGLKLPDAVHLATALAADCSAVVSDDRRLGGVPGLRLLGVDPFTVDDILRPRA